MAGDSVAERRKTSAFASVFLYRVLSNCDARDRKNRPPSSRTSDSPRSNGSWTDSSEVETGNQSTAAAARPATNRIRTWLDRWIMRRHFSGDYTPIMKHNVYGQNGMKLFPRLGAAAGLVPRFFGNTSKLAFAGRIRYGL